MFFSSAKARAALHYAPRPATQAIADAVAWFQSNV
jgi:dihydroflavonol-4-reductase